MRKLILTAVIALILSRVTAQRTYNYFDLGVGLGINYGGIGFNLSFAPDPLLSFEGAVGFNLVEYNFGGSLNIHVIPKNNNKVYGMALKTIYSYNAALIADGGDMESKSFYGFSFGISNKFRFGPGKKRGLDVDLIIPVRKSEVFDYYDELEENGYEMSKLLPIAISIGYHLEF